MLDLMDGGITMVLLVIDVQKLIVTESLYKFDLFVSNIKKLISAARKNKIEVIYVRHDDGEGCELTKGTDGFEIYDEFKPFSQEKIFDKSVNSAFRDTGLLDYLKNKNEKEVIVVGLQTDYCIDATVKCGFEHGFKITVPTNANSTVDNDFMTSEQSYKYYNEYMWNNRYASCISMDETINKMEE